jgi:hypothetical protein
LVDYDRPHRRRACRFDVVNFAGHSASSLKATKETRRAHLRRIAERMREGSFA